MKRSNGPLLLVALGTLALGGWTYRNDPYSLQPQSRLWIDGTSTVRDFQCKAPALSVAIEAADDAIPALLAAEKTFRSVRFDVAVDRMDCSNGTMNGHMLKALKAKEHPVISFRLDTYELSRSGDLTKGVLSGKLEIGGVERAVVLPVELKSGNEGALRVTGSAEINMRDFSLEPPSLMLGTLKVRHRVKVSFDLSLKN